MVHGSERNADDYFCSMLEAARLQVTLGWPTLHVAPSMAYSCRLHGAENGCHTVLVQTHWPADRVVVIAPRFTEPKDGPSPGSVTPRQRRRSLSGSLTQSPAHSPAHSPIDPPPPLPRCLIPPLILCTPSSLALLLTAPYLSAAAAGSLGTARTTGTGARAGTRLSPPAGQASPPVRRHRGHSLTKLAYPQRMSLLIAPTWHVLCRTACFLAQRMFLSGLLEGMRATCI